MPRDLEKKCDTCYLQYFEQKYQACVTLTIQHFGQSQSKVTAVSGNVDQSSVPVFSFCRRGQNTDEKCNKCILYFLGIAELVNHFTCGCGILS